MTKTKKLLEEHWEELHKDNIGAPEGIMGLLKDSFYNGAMVTLEALRVVGRDVILAEIKEYLEERTND